MRTICRSLMVAFLLATLVMTTLAPTSAEGGSATLDVKLRGCDATLFMPGEDDPFTACTVPLDAPDDAGVFWGGDGQGGMPLADTERLFDGTYRLEVPASMSVSLINFEPSERDTFLMVGTDGIDNDGDSTVTLAVGESRQVYVFYYNNPPQIQPATLNMTLRGCDDGFDPLEDDPFVECLVPLDAPNGAGVFWGGDGQGGMPLSDVGRRYDGTYFLQVPVDMSIALFGFEPTVRDAFIVIGTESTNSEGDPTVTVVSGEQRRLYIFYYNTP